MPDGDRTVVVTGGASGIGRATTEAFADRGERVIVADVDGDAAAETVAGLPGGAGTVVETDVRDEDAVAALATEVESRFGGADVLVNSAGVVQPQTPIDTQPVEEWDQVVEVHLRGTYLACRYLLPGMIERGRGAVVNLSSVVGLAGFPYRTAYGPAKSGINNLTKVLAIEAARSDVRVNAVAPGYVRTAMVEAAIGSGDIDPEALHERTPLGRLADPTEVADAIEYLASDRAAYVTGVVLPVDGGWTAYGAA